MKDEVSEKKTPGSPFGFHWNRVWENRNPNSSQEIWLPLGHVFLSVIAQPWFPTIGCISRENLGNVNP
ncbi:MAG: hypothetical protein JRK53_01370 [Deltaproteobacteria bacterium]|nr:hypothetical protein [Deltaproteobacteria bacterium]